jgi:hypothetical protein
MTDQPLLLFPQPAHVDRRKRKPGFGRFRRPDKHAQMERLSPQLSSLRSAFESDAVTLTHTLTGAEPELVVVIELVGTVDAFLTAVRNVEGLEWLIDIGLDDLPPDEEFFVEGSPEKSLAGQMYLVMTNRQAVEELNLALASLLRGRRFRLEAGLHGPKGRIFATSNNTSLGCARPSGTHRSS